MPRTEGPPPGAVPLPADFDAVEVRACGDAFRRADNGDEVHLKVERRAPVTAELLTYLAQPPGPSPEPGFGCRAIAVIPPWMALLDQGGHYLTPAVPLDACQLPLQWDLEGELPYERLDYTDVSAIQVGVVETAAAREAGCSMQHKNMLAIVPPDEPVELDPAVLAGGARRCDYVADDDPSGGIFTAGGPVDDREVEALLTAAADERPTGPAADCAPASRFTVLTGLATKRTVYLETDGCRRVHE